MSASRYLVTGAPGWLGTRLVECLLSGLPDGPALETPDCDAVNVLHHPDQSIDGLPVDPRLSGAPLDLAGATGWDRALADGAGSVLFHLAGVVHPSVTTSAFRRVNVEGTKRLLEAARAAGVQRFVYVSSNSPLGTNPTRDHLFDERSPYRPYLGYGESKRDAELAVAAAGQSSDLETVVIRPPWFYGVNQPPRQTLFFKMIKEGRFPLCGDGGNRRSMVYIDNLCQGLVLAATAPAAAGETYWIADEQPYTMNEIVQTIRDVLSTDFAMDVASDTRRLPSWVATAGEWADRCLQAVGLYNKKVHVLGELNKNIACTIEKAQRELGYAPAVGLREGMRRSVAWALEAGESI